MHRDKVRDCIGYKKLCELGYKYEKEEDGYEFYKYLSKDDNVIFININIKDHTITKSEDGFASEITKDEFMSIVNVLESLTSQGKW